MDENKQAILLLTSHFSTQEKGEPPPLTALEYGSFASWLKCLGAQPKDLFHSFDTLIEKWQNPKGKITKDRLQYLLGRGMAMGLALEKWQSAGIWILARSDSEYPKRLKARLGETAPAILFGVGNKALLNAGGLAIVGSRNINESELTHTQFLAKQAALEGLNLVSGGARGVDETGMLAALNVEGNAIGILANDLYKNALSGKWRKYLNNELLALVSTTYPEANFHVGHAMARNKYIYCLSDYALVMRCEEGSGGSWAGATENLKKKWVPLFATKNEDVQGNMALFEKGAYPIDIPVTPSALDGNWLKKQLNSPASTDDFHQEQEPPPITKLSQFKEIKTNDHIYCYNDFIEFVKSLLSEKDQVKLSELKVLMHDLKERQLREWLDQSVKIGDLKRHGQKLTYGLSTLDANQPDLFR